MSNFDKWQTEDRRLVILLMLAASDGYRCNEFLLQTLLEQRGHFVSDDRLRTDLRWLEEQGLLATEELAGTMIATINRRGVEVSEGRASVPGIKRPRPGA